MPWVVVSGAESLLRRRTVQSLLGDNPYQVAHTLEELERALASNMFGETPPIWCREVVPTEEVFRGAEHHELVIWELESEPTAKSPLGKRKAEAKQWFALPTPKPWEKRAAAVNFVRDEAMSHNLILSDGMVHSLVALVGLDLGILSFELAKMGVLAKQSGEYEVTPKILNQVLGGFVETGLEELVAALGQQNPSQIMGSMTLIERTYGVSSSTVLRLCATLVYHARIWLCCKTLCNGDPNPLSERLGIHAFVLRKQHFPHAARWSEQKLLTLIAGIAGVGRAVRRGQMAPHLRLQGLLVGLCATQS